MKLEKQQIASSFIAHNKMGALASSWGLANGRQLRVAFEN